MTNLKVVENGLIPVYESEKGNKLVNARELHEFLEVKTKFSDWIKERIEKYDFQENTDYIHVSEKKETSTGYTILKEYIFKLEPAKEIAMVENSEKGKQIRKYFIVIEEKIKSLMKPDSIEDLIIMQATAMKQMKQQVALLKETTQTIKDTIITQPDNLREEINRILNKISNSVGHNKYHEIRSESYKLLERRARVDLQRRLDNYRTRLVKEGAGKTKINQACKLDVIEQDLKLQEIYAKIIQEYTIKYVA